ncbi:DUF2931 family protein [Salmonella enterica subsp. salamae]|nr:DUF2931 family protein [Salmonella enterica subsp. salamae]EDN4180043.1 DUF2931 family protein [Salmonella enterica subsp. salamae]
MNIKTLTLTFLAMAALSHDVKGKELTSLLAPYDEWYFNFFYPKALPAQVTYVELLDTDGIFYKYRALDAAGSSETTIAKWNNNLSGGIPSFNKAKNPPQFIHFCWDSVIDKKVYETRITFSGTVWKMMLTPYPSVGNPRENDYHRFILIGLAPEGKVRVWLENDNKPNIPLTGESVILIETVSGKDLKMCKNITNHPDGYIYYGDTPDFIKGKKYPYGEW